MIYHRTSNQNPSLLSRRQLIGGLIATAAVAAYDSRSTMVGAAPPYRDEDRFLAGDTVRVTAGLWLRTAPSLSGSVITTMPTGTLCTIESGPSPSGGYTWYQVVTPYGVGWAAGEFLELITLPEEPDGYAPGTTLIVTAGLYLRTSPNLGSDVITTMPAGTMCTVVSGPSPSDGYTWYEVETPYGVGWAAGEYMEATPEPIGYQPGVALQVTAALWLRTAPNLGGSVITTMPTGTVCTVLSGPSHSDGYSWYELDTPYGTGWAAGEFLITVR